jgi:osmotically-inducible protein OsmY
MYTSEFMVVGTAIAAVGVLIRIIAKLAQRSVDSRIAQLSARMRAMPRSKTVAAAIGALSLTAAVSGYAQDGANEKCGSGSCSSDANITSVVQSMLAQHRELQGPDRVYVKTVNRVVYLSGTVASGLHRDLAASVARETPGVTQVVENIGLDK